MAPSRTVRFRSDLEIHASEVGIVVANFRSHASRFLYQLLREEPPSGATKVGVDVHVAKVTVESVFTASGAKAPWIMFIPENPCKIHSSIAFG